MGAIETAISLAKAQVGKPWVYNPTTSPSDPDPPAFDCSELTEWCFARARAGARLTESSYLQYWQCRDARRIITPAQAMSTPGALLFRFLSSNGAPVVPGRSGQGAASRHVAIAIGGGEVIEAANKSTGVRRSRPVRNTFTAGGLVPMLNYPRWGAGPIGDPPDDGGDPGTGGGGSAAEIRRRFRPRNDLPILRKGLESESVRSAQKLLIRVGAPELQPYRPNGTAKYGDLTRRSVIWFQQKVRREVEPTMRITGEIGPLTWGWLHAYLG